jgi:integrase
MQNINSFNGLVLEENSKMKKKFSLSSHEDNLSKKWYILYYVKNKAGKVQAKKIYGGINRFKTVEGRKKAADSLIRKLEKQNMEIYTPAFRFVDVSTVLSEGLETLRPRLRHKSYLTYRSKLGIFLSWTKAQRINNINAINGKVLNVFLNSLLDQKKSAATHNAFLTTIKRLFIVSGYSVDQLKGNKKLRKDSKPALYFQKHHIEMIRPMMQASDPQMWLFCQCIYYTLIRPGELRELKIADIDFEMALITITSDLSKNKKTEKVAIPNELMRVFMQHELYKYAPDYYLFGHDGEPGPDRNRKDHFNKKHRQILTTLKFDCNKYKLYSWKHTGAVGMVKNGIHIKQIQQQGRWHSLDQVNEYLRSLGVNELGDLKSKHVM